MAQITRMPRLGEGEKLRAGTRNEKDDHRMGAGTDKVADIAVGEADEGHQDDQSDQLGAETFHRG
ncbi:MAG: hypothetical protein EBX62_08710 [Betaproteobacteria bacterium]|nr:hypothetical protein [Betaproteobacteria bacterium]